MEKNNAWIDAIIKVLDEAKTSLHYRDITNKIFEKGYYTKSDGGSTPSMTVNKIIGTNILDHGENSPFVRVGRGIFILRKYIK
jgi:hypothetical protein